jgi:hypothetical protein
MSKVFLRLKRKDTHGTVLVFELGRGVKLYFFLIFCRSMASALRAGWCTRLSEIRGTPNMTGGGNPVAVSSVDSGTVIDHDHDHDHDDDYGIRREGLVESKGQCVGMSDVSAGGEGTEVVRGEGGDEREQSDVDLIDDAPLVSKN